jgi:hypothetical protein
MYLIALGNPFEGGIQLFANNDGLPFGDYDEAVKMAEVLFANKDWCVVPVGSIADVELEED